MSKFTKETTQVTDPVMILHRYNWQKESEKERKTNYRNFFVRYISSVRQVVLLKHMNHTRVMNIGRLGKITQTPGERYTRIVSG